MYKSTLRAVGGSVMFAVPKPILESLDLRANSEVDISIREGLLVVNPHPRPRYSLADLLAQCDPSAPMTGEDQAWLDAEPVGEELI